MQADPHVDPGLTALGFRFQRLKLQYDEPLSTFAFNFNLPLRYIKGFKGYITGTGPDGTVDAKLTIFGRETALHMLVELSQCWRWGAVN